LEHINEIHCFLGEFLGHFTTIISVYPYHSGASDGSVIEAQHYKPEGAESIHDGVNENFQ
jgi:hypothetical protein